MLGTVDRVGSVLNLYTPERPEWGATELANTLGIAKSQAHEILMSMTRIGLLQRTPQSRYRLGWRTVRLGAVAMRNEGLSAAAAPWMKRLVTVHPELSAHLAVWDVDRAIFVARQVGEQASTGATRVSPVGEEAPLHCTSLGKVLASARDESDLDLLLSLPRLERFTEATITHPDRVRRELALVRDRGFATDDGEFRSDMKCIAIPVIHHADRVVGAVAVCVPVASWSRRSSAYLHALSDTSRRIARAIARPEIVPIVA